MAFLSELSHFSVIHASPKDKIVVCKTYIMIYVIEIEKLLFAVYTLRKENYYIVFIKENGISLLPIFVNLEELIEMVANTTP